MEKKSLFEQIAHILHYLQMNDSNIRKRHIRVLEKIKGWRRVKNLCDNEHIKKETTLLPMDEKGGQEQIDSYRITLEGLKFLEEYSKEKRFNLKSNQNLFLTYSLFIAAFLQGTVLIAFNYLYLGIIAPSQGLRWFEKTSVIFLGFCIILLILISIAFWVFPKNLTESHV